MAYLKVILLIVTLFGIAPGRPEPSPSLGSALGGKKVTVLKDQRQTLDRKGNYGYDIELSDGTKLQQEGHTEAPGPGQTEGSLVVMGSYTYISPDGTPVKVSYVADKNGFQPKTEVVASTS